MKNEAVVRAHHLPKISLTVNIILFLMYILSYFVWKQRLGLRKAPNNTINY